MLPAQRRQELQQRIVHGLCMTTQCVDGPFQIHGVPQHNSRRDEAQAAGAVALLLEATVPDFSQPIEEHRPAQRLLALNQTHAMSETQLHAWCREKGLFAHQLKAWGEAFCSATASESREAKAALRELQVKHDGLQRELRRKERALAEAAALLMLQKKFQALWEDEEK